MGKAECIKINIVYPIRFNEDGKIIDLEADKEIQPHELYHRFGDMGFSYHVADRLLRKYPNELSPVERSFYDDTVRRFAENIMEAMKSPGRLVAAHAHDTNVFGVIRVETIDRVVGHGVMKVGFKLTLETFKAERIEETLYHCDPALLKKDK